MSHDRAQTPGQEQACELLLAGRVQGVGFRPFVYRTADALGLTGWVRNQLGQVQICIQGPADAVATFVDRIIHQAPPLARPDLVAQRPVAPADTEGFEILSSEATQVPHIHVPPDYFTCDDCLAELHDPTDRRYGYPFINCTQCGPRYTLIRRLPYDRANTTMAAFRLCRACAREYHDPTNRRFHAEPVACPECGPQLEFRDRDAAQGPADNSLAACLGALRAGRIVAVRGIGGYHLLCDARAPAAIARLRRAKPRPHKPLALMVPATGPDGLAAVRELAHVDGHHGACLTDPARPIVLVPLRPDHPLPPDVAPGLNEVGVMLPYSPLHHLLLESFGGPLVATSANVRGEPVLTEPAALEQRLAHVAAAVLDHNRPIQRPADDPVVRVIDGVPRPLRLGRGTSPLERDIPFHLSEPILAVGGHMKNTVALAWGTRVVVSPHIGDLDAPRSLAVFEQVIGDLQTLYRVTPARLVCDAHPGYASHRWAAAQGSAAPLRVWHHHAHASALAGEYPDERTWVVFAWDGVGLGEDGTLWGGETLAGGPGTWRRVGSLRPFALPGGERAARQPWRSAQALCWGVGLTWPNAPRDPDGLLYQAWKKGINAPVTSAVGRLFDGAAALLGLLTDASFEGQAPMRLEAAAEGGHGEALELPWAPDPQGTWRLDCAPLVRDLLDTSRGVADRAATVHASLARAIVRQAEALRPAHQDFAVGLTGGVFQNRLLSELALAALRDAGFRAYLPEAVPCNDGGLCFGQVIEAAAREHARPGP